MTNQKHLRHLLGISGGKDSAALAIYMKDKIQEMEYFFADMGAELPETLEFVDLQRFHTRLVTVVNYLKQLKAKTFEVFKTSKVYMLATNLTVIRLGWH